MIEVRLDRVLVSAGFLNLFNEAKLINLEVSTSDHSPILLELREPTIVTPTRRFRFENAWLREPMCQQIVAEVWTINSERYLYEKLQECLDILSKRGKKFTDNFKKRIQQCKKILRMLKGRRDSNSREVVKEEQKKLSESILNMSCFGVKGQSIFGLKRGTKIRSSSTPQ